MRVKCHTQNTIQYPWPGLKPEPLVPEANALTMDPLCLHTDTRSNFFSMYSLVGIMHARVLVRECLVETDRCARQ